MTMVLVDLKQTTKGYWWTGRKLLVRVHLAAYFLQQLYDLTDRAVEYGIKDNAAYQVFCGLGIVAGWHPLDHTKVESFRSRLSPETKRRLANELVKVAVTIGFADPIKADFDSTVQEANVAYPADASLMTKLSAMGKKVVDYLRGKAAALIPANLSVDMKKIKAHARAYFFMPKNTDINKRRSVFADLHQVVTQAMQPIAEVCAKLNAEQIAGLPWNIRRAVGQINAQATQYLLDVTHFIRTHCLKAGKVLAFHARAVACIKKGKVGKDKEFGRVYQLGRIVGNFLFVGACTSLRMDDKTSFPAMLSEHALLFGEGILESATADKGYWAAKNQQELTRRGIKESGLQRPSNIKNRDGLPSPEIQDQLRDRRAGIEALIGRTKHGGQLGRSRMKSDESTLAAGYSSVLGFNLRQLIRHQAGKMKRAA
jgi:transposase, IS5 family